MLLSGINAWWRSAADNALGPWWTFGVFQSFSPVAGIGEAVRERVSASFLTHSSSLFSGMGGALERRRKTYSVSFPVFRALSSLRVVSHWPSLLGDAMQWLDADQCVGAGLFWLKNPFQKRLGNAFLYHNKHLE